MSKEIDITYIAIVICTLFNVLIAVFLVTNKYYKYIIVFDAAEMLKIDATDEFSQWVANNKWELNYTTGKWENLDSLHQHSMSELYQMFLKSREA